MSTSVSFILLSLSKRALPGLWTTRGCAKAVYSNAKEQTQKTSIEGFRLLSLSLLKEKLKGKHKSRILDECSAALLSIYIYNNFVTILLLYTRSEEHYSSKTLYDAHVCECLAVSYRAQRRFNNFSFSRSIW